MKRRVITICAARGGCGKTSSTGAIGEAAARDGARVLLLDADSQCTLSLWYRADMTAPGMYELITGRAPLDDCIQAVGDNLSIIRASADLSGLTTGPASGQRLSNALRGSQRHFDFVLIDTSPTLSESLYNALYASDEALIPLLSDTASLQAYYQISDVVRQVRGAGKVPKIAGVFLTQYSRRANINRFFAETMRKQCERDKVRYLGEIRPGIAIRESQAMQRPLFDYSPRSRPAGDYIILYGQIKEG